MGSTATQQIKGLPRLRWLGYTTTTDGTANTPKSLAPPALSVSSIAHTGGVATVTMAADHPFSPGMEVTIAGANQSEYNQTWQIETVPSSTTFTFKISSTPTSPATGTITLTWVCHFQHAFVRIPGATAVQVGPIPNLYPSGNLLSGMVWQIPNVTGAAFNMADWYSESTGTSQTVEVYFV